jgi:hypothetical protein
VFRTPGVGVSLACVTLNAYDGSSNETNEKKVLALTKVIDTVMYEKTHDDRDSPHAAHCGLSVL